jgi:hypothetical protein
MGNNRYPGKCGQCGKPVAAWSGKLGKVNQRWVVYCSECSDVPDELRPQPVDTFQMLYDAAHKAGMDAGNAAVPTPMVVQQHANMADDNSQVVKQWFVGEGLCGFAWIVIRPGNCSFARWLKSKNLANKHYYGGVSVWVRDFGQSMTRKEAYAYAFAKVLKDAGITAYADSRLD